MLTSKVGMATKSHDAAFDEINRKFTSFEKTSEKLEKDATSYRESVQSACRAGPGVFGQPN